jgi:predicted RNA-binding Zn-ribbon protein involved in translation (DUF1610 family)
VSLTAHDPLRMRSTVIGGTVDPQQALDGPNDVEPVVDEDTIIVTCSACGTRQGAAGRAGGYTCRTCGSDWRVLRCRGCRQASVVLDGVTECPRCHHEHRPADRSPASRLPSWLTDPNPLSVWLGGVKYLGGHADRDQPVSSAGLLLDRRGIHLRAFAELFTIPWSTVQSVKIEGPADISERITVSRLVALGASTWVTSVAYLTVHTAQGDAIFEIDGLGPPELRARLSRVLQGLDRSGARRAPVALERDAPAPASVSGSVVAPPEAPAAPREPAMAPAPASASASAPVSVPERNEPSALEIDPSSLNAPIDVLVVDALWKLSKLRDGGMLHPDEVSVLRSRLLARVTRDDQDPDDAGPLLRV